MTRRVTKKEIVYKKDKAKSIVTISIKKDYINLYTLSDIEDLILMKEWKMYLKRVEIR